MSSFQQENINAHHSEPVKIFASGQYISNLAYSLSEQEVAGILDLSQPIPVLCKEGDWQSHFVHPLQNGRDGLVGYVLVPEEVEAAENLPSVKVIFRGTEYSDVKSLINDLDPEGPGVKAYMANSDSILHQVADILEKVQASSVVFDTLEVAGHSQGGCFAQLFTTDFMKACANEAYPIFMDVQTLEMTALNSPGVPQETAVLSDELALMLSNHDKPLEMVANYGMVGGDILQGFGIDMVLLGNDLPNVTVNLLKVDVGCEGALKEALHHVSKENYSDVMTDLVTKLYLAHVNENFFAPSELFGPIQVAQDYTFYSSQNLEELSVIQAKLLNKSYFAQYVLHPVQDALYQFMEKHSDKITEELSKIKTIYHFFDPPEPQNALNSKMLCQEEIFHDKVIFEGQEMVGGENVHMNDAFLWPPQSEVDMMPVLGVDDGFY